MVEYTMMWCLRLLCSESMRGPCRAEGRAQDRGPCTGQRAVHRTEGRVQDRGPCTGQRAVHRTDTGGCLVRKDKTTEGGTVGKEQCDIWEFSLLAARRHTDVSAQRTAESMSESFSGT